MSNELLHNSDVSQSPPRSEANVHRGTCPNPSGAWGEVCSRHDRGGRVAVAAVETIVTILSPKSAMQPALIKVKARQVRAHQIGDRSPLFKAARSDDV